MITLYHVITLVFLGGLLLSCQDEEFNVQTSESSDSETNFSEGSIILGDKLENPYTVKNMRKAYDNLSQDITLKSSNISENEISTTHFYVRFLPKTFEESLRGAKSLENWRDNLKAKYDNSTEEFVDELFENYIEL